MNIIEQVREILEGFPRIAEVCGSIHVDFADPRPTSYGLSSIGDTLLFEDIIGNQRRQHTFLLYTTYSGMNDYERLCNSSALLELSLWIEKQTGGCITKLSAENGMLYAVPQENLTDGVQYQMQITAEYTVPRGTESEADNGKTETQCIDALSG